MSPGLRRSGLLLAVALLPACTAVRPGIQHPEATSGELFGTIAALDAAAFAAFNDCASPGQLEKHGSAFATDVEFYHDNGGVTWSRAEMLANTAKFVCGKFRRELVAESLRVFPIKGYGAIAQGQHRFCPIGGSRCEGMADFTMVWRNDGGRWQITRVLSYGHRPIPD